MGDGTPVEIRGGPKVGEEGTVEKVEVRKGEGGGWIADVRYSGALNGEIGGQVGLGISSARSVPLARSVPADSEVMFTPGSAGSETASLITRHSDEWYEVAAPGKEGCDAPAQAQAISQHPARWSYDALNENNYPCGDFRTEVPRRTNPCESPSAARSKEKGNPVEQLPGYHYNPDWNAPYPEDPFSGLPAGMQNIGRPPDYWIGSGPCPPAFGSRPFKPPVAVDVEEKDMRLPAKVDAASHLSPEEQRAMAAAKRREQVRGIWAEQVRRGPEHVPRAGEATRFTLRRGRFVPIAVPPEAQENYTRNASSEPSLELGFPSQPETESLVRKSYIPRYGMRQPIPQPLPKKGSDLPVNVGGSRTSKIPTSRRDSGLSKETFRTEKAPHVESSPEILRHAQNLGISDFDHGFGTKMCAARIEKLKMSAAQSQDPRSCSRIGPADF